MLNSSRSKSRAVGERPAVGTTDRECKVFAQSAHLIEQGPGLRTEIAAWAEKDPLISGNAPADFDGVQAAIADGLMDLLQPK